MYKKGIDLIGCSPGFEDTILQHQHLETSETSVMKSSFQILKFFVLQGNVMTKEAITHEEDYFRTYACKDLTL